MSFLENVARVGGERRVLDLQIGFLSFNYKPRKANVLSERFVGSVSHLTDRILNISDRNIH